jgi:Sulfatase
MTRSFHSNRLWWLHVAALWALSVAHPLLNLVGGNPDFLVAHGFGRAGVFGLAAALVLLGPLPLIAIVAAARLTHKSAGTIAVGVVVGALAALACMQIAKRLSPHAAIVIPVAAAGGILCAVSYTRHAFARTVASMLAVGIVAVPVAFWMQPDVFRILSARETVAAYDGGQPATPQQDIPVVVLVFDEISLVSLLDADAKIDPVLFPNLADLATAGVWFRNATTVSDYTRWALPAIVTGKVPRSEATPSARDYPQSLFTWLARSHDVVAVESVTDLCPDHVCSGSDRRLDTSVERVVRDLFVVYQHIVLPADLTRRLPDLATTWADFQRPDVTAVRRARQAERRRRRSAPSPDKRVERIDMLTRRMQQPRSRPGLFFLHSMLSHTPHWLLPSGQIDSTRSTSSVFRLPVALPGRVPEPWPRDEWLMAHLYQRHLLQLGFVDRVIGRIMATLKAAKLYDRSLVVIMADHGATFRPGLPRRDFRPETAAEIMRVPLLMKLPAGSPARVAGTFRVDGQTVSDRNVELIDVVPTIAGVLGVRLPWSADGQSLVDGDAERPRKTIFYDMARRREEFDRRGPDIGPALRAKLETFDGAANPSRVPRPPGFGELVGQPLDRVRVVDGGCAVSVENLAEFSRIDRDAGSMPFEVAGQLDPGFPTDRLPFLAVSVNGTIRAVTRAWQTAPGEWVATPPLDAWREGANSVDVFRVDESPAGLLLRRCTVRDGSSQGDRG